MQFLKPENIHELKRPGIHHMLQSSPLTSPLIFGMLSAEPLQWGTYSCRGVNLQTCSRTAVASGHLCRQKSVASVAEHYHGQEATRGHKVMDGSRQAANLKMQRWGKEIQAAEFAKCHSKEWRQLLCEQCEAFGSALGHHETTLQKA